MFMYAGHPHSNSVVYVHLTEINGIPYCGRMDLSLNPLQSLDVSSLLVESWWLNKEFTQNTTQ